MTTQNFVDSRNERVSSYDTPTTQMNSRQSNIIPDKDNIGYSDVIEIDMGVVYVDLEGFSKLVNSKNTKTIARIMTIYVTETTAAIRHHGGYILDIQGDGILAGFTSNSEEGNTPSSTAYRSTTTIETLLNFVVNPRLQQFQQDPLVCRYSMDYGKVLVTRAGIRGQEKNDRIFIGKAINRTVKIQSLTIGDKKICTTKFHNNLENDYKGDNMEWTSKETDYGTLWEREAKNWRGIE